MFKIGQRVIITAKNTKWHGKIFTVVGYRGYKKVELDGNGVRILFSEDDVELCNTWK